MEEERKWGKGKIGLYGEKENRWTKGKIGERKKRERGSKEEEMDEQWWRNRYKWAKKELRERIGEGGRRRKEEEADEGIEERSCKGKSKRKGMG